MSNPGNLTTHAGARPLGVVVRLEGVAQPVPLHVIGWAELEGGGWEAVVAMPDTTARRSSELEGVGGVLEVLGIGPISDPPPQVAGALHLPTGGLPITPAMAR